MKRYLLDTGIAQDLIDDRHGVRGRVASERARSARIGICTPVLGELWSGVEGSASRDRNEHRLRAGTSSLTVWPFTDEAAAEFGRLFANLRRIGRPMQQIDIQIAAIALTLGKCTVVTKDSDFSAIPGLGIENWAIEQEPTT